MAPGGGSVAALCGALSAALSAMVATLTWSKKGMQSARPAMKRIGDRGQTLKDFFLQAVDRDTDAFNAVIAAMRLPRKSAAEIEARDAAIERANQRAAEVPLEVVERSLEALEIALEAATEGNPNSVSDVGVAGACALAAAEGAALNVRINLPTVGDADVAASFRERLQTATGRARSLAAEVAAKVDEVLERNEGPGAD